MTEYEIKIKKVMDITESVVDAFRKGLLSPTVLGDITDILDEYTDLISENDQLTRYLNEWEETV